MSVVQLELEPFYDNKQQIQVTIRMQERTESWRLAAEPALRFLLSERSAGIVSVKGDSDVKVEIIYSAMTPIYTQ